MPTSQTDRPAIVLVEDEPEILMILRRLMQDLVGGYDIVAIQSGAEALTTIARQPVPLLITDYTMLGMHGLELTRAVKAASPATTVVLITAYHTSELERRAQALGVDHYLPKPFPLERLEAIVRAALTPAPEDGDG